MGRSMEWSDGPPNVPAFSCGRQRERSDRQARLLQRLVGLPSSTKHQKAVLVFALDRYSSLVRRPDGAAFEGGVFGW